MHEFCLHHTNYKIVILTVPLPLFKLLLATTTMTRWCYRNSKSSSHNEKNT